MSWGLESDAYAGKDAPLLRCVGLGWVGERSASSLRHTNLDNVEARPERKALAAVSPLLVETVEDGALG